MTNISSGADKITPLAFLRDSPLFQGTSEEELEKLANSAHAHHLHGSRQLFASGEPAGVFYAVISGEVHLYRPSPNGEEILYQILGQGSLLAEAAMFLEPPRYPLTARVNDDVHLFAFPRQALLALCDSSPEVMRTLLGALSRRLYQAVNRIEQLSLKNAGQRLVAYLLELRQHQTGHWIDIPVNIDLPVNLAVLAVQLAMTPETLSRLLQKFRREGLISGRGRTLVLLDIAALCNRVELPVPDNASGDASNAMVGCCNLV